MRKFKGNTLGTLLSLAGVLILSPDTLLISSVKADIWTLIFWRGLLTAMTVGFALAFLKRKRLFTEVVSIGFPGLLVASFFAMSTVSFVTSVRLTKAANALVIVAAMPLIAAVFTRIFLREKVPGRTWAAVVVGFIGITLVFSGNLGSAASVGDLLALVTALLMAGNFVIIRKFGEVDMLPAVVMSGVVTTIFAAIMASPFSLTGSDFLLLAGMGGIVLPIPLAVMTVAPKLIPPAEVGLIMLLETFLGPIWVWLALREAPGFHTVLGGAILVLTLVLHEWAGMRRQPRPGGF
jgi:drug/metabolite transporter (DMT)-like permease